MGVKKEPRNDKAVVRKGFGDKAAERRVKQPEKGFVTSRHVWKNGMIIETTYNPESFNDEPADCISLEIHPGPGRGAPALFYMNAEDAIAIIHSLSSAVAAAIEDRKSPWPVEKK